MTPEQYCRKICRQSGSTFVYTFWLFGRKRRTALEGFYAFCREVDDAVDHAANFVEANQALLRWRKELEQIYQKTPQSPIGIALVPAVERYQIPKKYLAEIIAGCEMDLLQTSYPSFEELEKYCFRVASCVGMVCLYIFGVSLTPPTEHAGICLGKAMQLTNILRDIASDQKRGRNYLPQNDIHGAISRARSLYQEAWKNFPQDKRGRRKLTAAVIMGRCYEAILDKIEANPSVVSRKKIVLTKFEKLRIAVKVLLSLL